jgi:hypothetical protein
VRGMLGCSALPCRSGWRREQHRYLLLQWPAPTRPHAKPPPACMFFLFLSSLMRPRHSRALVSLWWQGGGRGQRTCGAWINLRYSGPALSGWLHSVPRPAGHTHPPFRRVEPAEHLCWREDPQDAVSWRRERVSGACANTRSGLSVWLCVEFCVECSWGGSTAHRYTAVRDGSLNEYEASHECAPPALPSAVPAARRQPHPAAHPLLPPSCRAQSTQRCWRRCATWHARLQ